MGHFRFCGNCYLTLDDDDHADNDATDAVRME
jgi:hypothetical protein